MAVERSEHHSLRWNDWPLNALDILPPLLVDGELLFVLVAVQVDSPADEYVVPELEEGIHARVDGQLRGDHVVAVQTGPLVGGHPFDRDPRQAGTEGQDRVAIDHHLEKQFNIV